MVVLFAREIASKGYEVYVFCSCFGSVFLDQYVQYIDRSHIHNYEHSGTLIAFKDQDALYLMDFSKRYLWTTDPVVLEPAQRQLCDGLFGLGPWHKQELEGLNPGFDRISYIEPGIQSDFSRVGKGVKRVQKQCLYASSPDRGLEFLESIWPQIQDAHPDATLITTYSGAKRRTNEQMIRLYQQSDILAYPCSGAERYCITAIKAQIYGALPVVVPHMALAHTVQFGIKCLQKDYLTSIIELLNDPERRANIRQKMIKDVKYNTWGGVVSDWEKVIGKEQESSAKF